jgi:radical SAM protein with 4Fe4S-binding SPASM domain
VLLEDYPALKNNVKLFISYNRSTIILKDKGAKFSLNNDGAKLVKEFNGKKTFEQIINLVLNRQIDNIHEEETHALFLFLDELAKKDFLDILKYPAPRKLDVIGKLENVSPFVVTVELTDKCNFRCRYCYGDCSIDRSNFLKNPIGLFSYLAEIGVYGVELSGGEPLYHPEIDTILEILTKNFEVKGILINGTLIREKHLDILKNNEVGKVIFQICIDGSNKKSVESSSCVPGSFDAILDGIKLIKKHGFAFRVGMVVDHPDKIAEIEDTLLLARELGANLFVASPLLNFGRGRSLAEHFSPNDNLRLFEEIRRMQQEYKAFFQAIEDVRSFEETKNCGLGSKTLTIKVDGNLKPCPATNFDFKIGKWNELYGDKVQEKLKLLANLDKPNLKDCEDCAFGYYCSGCVVKGIDKMLELDRKCSWFIKNKEALSTIAQIQ